MSYSGSKSRMYTSSFSDMAGADLMSGDMTIEADGDFDSGPVDVDDEDLNAAFEAEHGGAFTVIDEVGGEDTKRRLPASREKDGEKKKYVIPKVRLEKDETSYGSGDERKREWRKNERNVRPKDHDVGRRNREDYDKGKRERDGRERDTKKKDRDDSWDRKDSLAERARHQDQMNRESQNGRASQRSPPMKPSHEKRQSLFESFAKEGLIADEQYTMPPNQSAVQGDHGKEGSSGTTGTMKDTQLAGEEESALEIPMGRDSLVFVRDYHAWQIRVHPVSKGDMARADFAQIWGVADSSSVVWSSQEDFGGVAEFLLKDENSIQKFMRKIMWHNFSSDVVTMEITEREKSKFSEQDVVSTFDTIANKMIFKYNKTRARQLIKTYYPTPQGEVTERSVYVNNINSGKAVNLLKAVFPCAAKISVARSTKETSSALVETAGIDEAFNYLVVYDQININNSEVLISTVHSDWEGAKKQYENKDSKRKMTTESVKPSSTNTSDSRSGKRPADTAANNNPAKRGKAPSNPSRKPECVRGRGASSRGGPRGRGGRGRAPPIARMSGQPLLPNPPIGGGDGLLPLPGPPPEPVMGGSDGLLPRPDHVQPPPALLTMPVNPTPKGVIEGGLLEPPEPDYHTLELKEIRLQLESRVLETRAQLESHLSKLDHVYGGGLPSKPRRPVDYREEEDRHRDVPRRTLLPLEGNRRSEREDWLEEPDNYRRSAPHTHSAPPPSARSAHADQGYEADMSYGRTRREVDYGDVRSSHQRPYLLEAPPEHTEEPGDRKVYDYDHTHRHTHVESEVRRDDSRPLLSRPPLLERDRRDYSEERGYSMRDYGDMETRRVPSYGAYEEDNRRLAARYSDDYDRRY